LRIEIAATQTPPTGHSSRSPMSPRRLLRSTPNFTSSQLPARPISPYFGEKKRPFRIPPQAMCTRSRHNNFNGTRPPSFHSPWFSSSLAPKLAYDTLYPICNFSLSDNNCKLHLSLVLSRASTFGIQSIWDRIRVICGVVSDGDDMWDFVSR
jgi:hypothetical protein